MFGWGIADVAGQQLLQRPVNSSVNNVQSPFTGDLVYDEATSPRRSVVQPVEPSSSPFGSYRPNRIEITEMSTRDVKQLGGATQQSRIRPVTSNLAQETAAIPASNSELRALEQSSTLPLAEVGAPQITAEPFAALPQVGSGRSFIFSSAYHPWTSPDAVSETLPHGAVCCDEWLDTCKSGECCNQFGIFPKPFWRTRWGACQSGCK
jgi:hypothetical protein